MTDFQRFRKVKNKILDYPYYLGDAYIITISYLKNILFKGFIYDKNVVAVTGSDANFAQTLFQLLDNLRLNNFFTDVIVYDLGMTLPQLNQLKNNYSFVEIKKFEFNKYPKFISKRDDYGTLGAYAWKPNIILEILEDRKSKVVWLDSANLINSRFKRVLAVLTNKGFFSPMSAGRVEDYTYSETLKTLEYPTKKYKKRNLTGGFVGFDWNNIKSRKLAQNWAELSNIEELILPKKSTKYNHRWDQSLLTILHYSSNDFGYIPKIKKLFGIRVNQNPNQDYFLFDSTNSEKNKDFYLEWYKRYKNISTKTIRYSKVIWLLSFESISSVKRKYLRTAKVVVSIYSDVEFENLKKHNNFNFVDTIFYYGKSQKLFTDLNVYYIKSESSFENYRHLLEKIKDEK